MTLASSAGKQDSFLPGKKEKQEEVILDRDTISSCFFTFPKSARVPFLSSLQSRPGMWEELERLSRRLKEAPEGNETRACPPH